MPKLYLNALQAFDDFTSSIVLYVVYAFAALVVLLWIAICLKQARGLPNHRNAAALRGLEGFMRTVDSSTKQTDELFAILTKNKNDIVMLFLAYCRMYDDFNNIRHYLNYRTFKKINKKQKPWGFTSIVAVTLLITLAVSLSHFIGLENITRSASGEKILQAVAVPVGLLIVWLLCLMLVVLKFKMYWLEFENLFRKVSEVSGTFFANQAAYYEEFSANILNIEPTNSGIRRRIERMISKTDPNEQFNVRPYAARKKPGEEPQEQQGQQGQNMPGMRNFQQMPVMPTMPVMPGVRVLKPHPETEAYMQAQAQITQQLMQMMMQQSLQQTQVVQNALTSQQALASSVVQQNIMAMRLEAQQAALKRPDFGKYTPPWMMEGLENAESLKTEGAVKKRGSDIPPKVQGAEEAVTIEADGTAAEIQPDAAAGPAAQATQPASAEPVKPKNAELVERLKRAFEFLSPPKQENASSEPDPVFAPPGRDQTNIEKRLGQFFSGTVYVYDEG